MRTSAFLPALLIATSASAQTATFSLTLTPENGGADTRLTWNYTGTPTEAPTVSGWAGSSGLLFVSGNEQLSSFTTVSGTAGIAFESNLTSITGLTTGLILTNTTTNVSREITLIEFTWFGSGAAINFTWEGYMDVNNRIAAELGESVVTSGPTSGSVVANIAFSNFNTGSWNLDNANYSNFDTTLTVSPVPEPSTYGLILGSLALVGAAVCRRRKAA